MWVLLFAAYLLGIMSGFWLKPKPAYDDEYESTRVYETQDNQQSSITDSQYQPEAESENEYIRPQIYERKRIYETPPDNQAPRAQRIDHLSDLPNLTENDIAHKQTAVEDTVAPSNRQRETRYTEQKSIIQAKAPGLYSAPMQGPPDDLKRVKGIGPTLERTLNSTGIYYFKQIAEWTEQEIAWIDDRIDFPGRVQREQWVGQSIVLAKEKESEEANAKNMTVSKKLTSQKIESAFPEPRPKANTPSQQVAKTLKAPHQENTINDTEALTTRESTNVPESMLDRLRANAKKDS